MEVIWKRSDVYRQIARQGISFSTLRQDRIGGPNSWIVQVWKDSELPNDKAKDLVRAFLENEYDATHITFFTTKGSPRNKFWARFITYVL